MFKRKKIMSEINGKFVKFEVAGETKDKALSTVETLAIGGDATQAFKNWQKKIGANYTERDVKEFMSEYLAKKGNRPGIGYVITKVSAVESTRERPWKINNVKNEQGRRQMSRVYTLIDNLGNVLTKVSGNKKVAEEKVKDLIKKGLKIGGKCEIEYVISKGEKTAFTWDYVPSKNSRMGEYTVFGLEKLN